MTKMIKMVFVFRAVTDELHRRSLASQQFGRRAARALGQVAQLEVCVQDKLFYVDRRGIEDHQCSPRWAESS